MCDILSEVHMTKGKIISYVLRLEGDDNNPFYIYCGMSQDMELRMLDHARGQGR